MASRAVVPFCVMALLLALASSCGLGGGSDGGGATAPPTANGGTATQPETTAPEEALRLFVQRRLNQGFVADCGKARRPDDVGKQCTRFRADRNGLRAYELGPTFSEYTRLIILQRAGDSWTIAHLENRDPNAPPVPGIPWPLEVGANVVVAGTANSGNCLRVRDRPGLQAGEVTCLDDGTVVSIAEGPVDIDGFEWWRLEGYGWAASNWLRYPEDVPEVPTVTPQKTPQ